MRAIVVVNDDIELDEMKLLASHGAVGARVNMLFASNARLEKLQDLANKMADLDWHLQVLADVSNLPRLAELVDQLPVPLVFDHMGHVPVGKGLEEPGFQTLLKLLDTGDVWVKLSGAYRITANRSGDYSDVSPTAQALISANPGRLVWGSDWPHPSFDGPMPNDADLIDDLFNWTDGETSRRILVENAERLYGFPPWGSSHE